MSNPIEEKKAKAREYNKEYREKNKDAINEKKKHYRERIKTLSMKKEDKIEIKTQLMNM